MTPGANPSVTEEAIQKRESDYYKQQYIHNFVEKWDQLINWDARAESEGDFFIRLLRERGVKRVLDVATGTGYHSIQLLKAGFEVASVEGSAEMLSRAFENGRREGFILRTVCADWRWLCRDVHARFDAVVCLGNSFTHLFTERDRRKALAEFYSVLKHDGVLVLDQRNYDAILDDGFDCKHIYYYCGDNVKAEPEHVDEGLARFRYEFPDGSIHHLNMCPIRKNYVRKLMKEVGFTNVNTYGDFKATYHDNEPDFLVHIAEKLYDRSKETQSMAQSQYNEAVETARSYYNSEDADKFYYLVWGGTDIHIGIYDEEGISVRDASEKTVARMAKQLEDIGALDKNKRVLDIGSGYGGAGRFLAKNYGCSVSCLNLSERQNERARQANREENLEMLISVTDGSFESIPAPTESYDVVWSQDAILHSGHRVAVFEEVNRVLKPGGYFILTDPMAAGESRQQDLQPILDRIQLSSLGSLASYRKYADALGLEEVQWTDLTDQLTNHYGRIHQEIDKNYDFLIRHCTEEYLQNMKKGLNHWVEGGKSGKLQWGILIFKKKQ